jgi:hypothetical protein
MGEGKFPRPIRLGPKAVAWLPEYRRCEVCKAEYRTTRTVQAYCSPRCRREDEHELDAYLAARLRERDGRA